MLFERLNPFRHHFFAASQDSTTLPSKERSSPFRSFFRVFRTKLLIVHSECVNVNGVSFVSPPPLTKIFLLSLFFWGSFHVLFNVWCCTELTSHSIPLHFSSLFYPPLIKQSSFLCVRVFLLHHGRRRKREGMWWWYWDVGDEGGREEEEEDVQ